MYMIDDAKKIAQVNFKLNEIIRTHFKDKFTDVRTIKTPYGELGELLYHIFDSPNYWLDIMTGEEDPIQSYEKLTTVQDFYYEWKKVDNRLIEYVENNNSKENLQRTIYINEPDFKIETTVEDLLMHISHHSMYHRGSLGAIIRNTNLPPLPSSTWAFAKRK